MPLRHSGAMQRGRSGAARREAVQQGCESCGLCHSSAHRLLHGEQRQDLEQVVLDHVAHNAVLHREAGQGCQQ